MQVKIDFIINESNWNSRGINKAVGFSFIYIILGSISFFSFLVWKNVIIVPTKPLFFCLKKILSFDFIGNGHGRE